MTFAWYVLLPAINRRGGLSEQAPLSRRTEKASARHACARTRAAYNAAAVASERKRQRSFPSAFLMGLLT